MKESESPILFDIDHVLFNDGLFIEKKRSEIAKIFGLTPDNIEQYDREAADQTTEEKGRSDIVTYSRKLSGLLSKPERFTDIIAIFDTSSLYLESLYQDSVDVLEKLKKVFRIGVFSEGDKDFQMKKLEKSGILELFDKRLIFIYSNKLSKISRLAKKYKPLAVIDDRPKFVIAWANHDISKAIRIKRGRYQTEKIPEKRGNVFEVENLEAILPILRK